MMANTDRSHTSERAGRSAANLTGTGQITLASHQERPVPPAALRALYVHVNWVRRTDETGLAAVLAAGPAIGAWDGEELVGFVRALSDGHLAAYIEDVMVHQRHRKSGLGSALMTRLLAELEAVAVINLFCAPETVPFYEKQGFGPTTNVLTQRRQRKRPA